MPLPRSLAHLKREISEKKWVEARSWAGRRVSSKKYRLPREQRPDKVVVGQLQEACLKVLPAEARALPHEYLGWMGNQPTAKCWCFTGHRRGITCSSTVPAGNRSRRSCGWRYGRRAGEGKIGLRSGTFWPIRGAASRCWTPSPLRMWGGGSWPGLRTMQRARCRNGSCGDGG
jgi:hypothetical protein